MQKPVALVFALLLAFGAIAVVPGAGAVPIISGPLVSTGTACPAALCTDGSATSGDTNGGEVVRIVGSGFSDEPEVSVGGLPAEVLLPTSDSDNIDIIIP